MFSKLCCCLPCCKKTITYEESVTVRPKQVTISSSPSPTTTDSRAYETAHTRFRSTEEVSLGTALRTTRPISIIIEDPEKQVSSSEKKQG